MRRAALALQRGLNINVEAHLPAATIEGLRARGHQVGDIHDSYQDFGAGQFIWRLGDPAVEGYVAVPATRAMTARRSVLTTPVN